MSRQSRIFWLRLLVGIILLCIVFSGVGLAGFIDVLSKANLIYVFIPIILYFFPCLWLSVVKWNLFLNIYNINVSSKNLYIYYLIGTFFNNFLPSTIGGDISRVVYLKQETNKPSEVAASVVMERFTGLVALIFLSICSVALDSSSIPTYDITLYIIIIISIFIIVVAMVLKNHLHRHVLPVRLAIIEEKIEKFAGAIAVCKEHRGVLAISFMLSILFVTTSVISVYMYFLSIDVVLPFSKVLLIYTVVHLISLLPISINSLGVSEISYVMFYGLIGVSSEDALFVALLGRMIAMLLSLSGGVLFIFKKNIIKNPS